MAHRVILLFLVLSLASCASSGGTYNVIDIESVYDIVYVHNHRELVRVRGGVEHISFIQSRTAVIHPRFSPDGSRIAWVDVGTATLPVSSTVVTAYVADVLETPQQSFDTRSVPIAGIDLDHKLMIEDAVAPVWLPDGSAVLYAHGGGVDRVTADAQLTTLSDLEGIKAMALAPSGSDLVLATASNLYALPLAGGAAEALLSDDTVPQFGNKQIRTIMFSPEGDRAVFALASTLFSLDLDSGEVAELFADNQNIYWAGWLAGSDEIIYLAGLERHRGRRMTPYQDVDGEFRLNVITAGGSFQRELFRSRIRDVREVVPNLSPDGVFVSVSSRPYPKEVYVIATDGAGVHQLTFDGPNSYSTWRPTP